jgi:hypothetical protein
MTLEILLAIASLGAVLMGGFWPVDVSGRVPWDGQSIASWI